MTLKAFFKDYLEILAYAVYAIFLFLIYRKERLHRYKILFYYYMAASALMLESAIFSNMDNNWNYNLLFLLTIVTYSWYFQSLFSGILKRRIVAFCLSINLLVFIYYNVIRESFLASYNNYVFAFSFITIVIFTLLYFHQLLLHVKEESLLDDFDFWLICGYLFYFLGSFVIIIYYKDAPTNSRAVIWSYQSFILFFSTIFPFNGLVNVINNKKRNHAK